MKKYACVCGALFYELYTLSHHASQCEFFTSQSDLQTSGFQVLEMSNLVAFKIWHRVLEINSGSVFRVQMPRQNRQLGYGMCRRHLDGGAEGCSARILVRLTHGDLSGPVTVYYHPKHSLDPSADQVPEEDPRLKICEERQELSYRDRDAVGEVKESVQDMSGDELLLRIKQEDDVSITEGSPPRSRSIEGDFTRDSSPIAPRPRSTEGGSTREGSPVAPRSESIEGDSTRENSPFAPRPRSTEGDSSRESIPIVPRSRSTEDTPSEANCTDNTPVSSAVDELDASSLYCWGTPVARPATKFLPIAPNPRPKHVPVHYSMIRPRKDPVDMINPVDWQIRWQGAKQPFDRTIFKRTFQRSRPEVALAPGGSEVDAQQQRVTVLLPLALDKSGRLAMHPDVPAQYRRLLQSDASCRRVAVSTVHQNSPTSQSRVSATDACSGESVVGADNAAVMSPDAVTACLPEWSTSGRGGPIAVCASCIGREEGSGEMESEFEHVWSTRDRWWKQVSASQRRSLQLLLLAWYRRNVPTAHSDPQQQQQEQREPSGSQHGGHCQRVHGPAQVEQPENPEQPLQTQLSEERQNRLNPDSSPGWQPAHQQQSQPEERQQQQEASAQSECWLDQERHDGRRWKRRISRGGKPTVVTRFAKRRCWIQHQVGDDVEISPVLDRVASEETVECPRSN